MSAERELRDMLILKTSQSSTGGDWTRHSIHTVKCDTDERIWDAWGAASSADRGRKPDMHIPFDAVALMYQEQTARERDADAYHLANLVKAARGFVDAQSAINGGFLHGLAWDADCAAKYFEGKAASAEPTEDDDVPADETETQGSDE